MEVDQTNIHFAARMPESFVGEVYEQYFWACELSVPPNTTEVLLHARFGVNLWPKQQHLVYKIQRFNMPLPDSVK